MIVRVHKCVMVNGSNKSTLFCIPPVLYCRPKHPTKVHVWAGISMKGRTGICTFDGIMKELYMETWMRRYSRSYVISLVTATTVSCRTTTRSMLHISHELGCKRMRWTGGRHHPSLPTLNPIENLWHEPKEYIHPTRSQATHKGWTCGSHNSFLEYSGCYKV